MVLKTKVETSIHRFCEFGDTREVQAYLASGGDIEARDDRGRTLLAVSLRANKIEVAKLLVEKGADVNATNLNGTTIFMYAKTPLMGTGGFHTLEWLLKIGARINSKDKFGKTVLDYVGPKDPAMARFLQQKGALSAELV